MAEPSELQPQLHLGTCSWSTSDWVGLIYQPGTKSVDYIAQYAERFNAVEVDSTFYAIPRASVVQGWAARTPENFTFAVKAPQTITHEKFMVDCEHDVRAFLHVMDLLGPRLGPILFQFPYFAKRKNVTAGDFMERLEPFLKCLPREGYRFAVEVRNKTWITKPLLNLLREHKAALALIDHPWMYRPTQLFRSGNVFTSDFLYIRWLGDRYKIEEITKTWNQHVVDRENDMAEWMPGIKQALSKHMDVFGFVNSHYSGYAPGDVERLERLLKA